MLGLEGSLHVWLQTEKHLVPFNKLTFRTALIYLFLHAVLSHDQILFESTENGHGDCKIAVNLMNL